MTTISYRCPGGLDTAADIEMLGLDEIALKRGQGHYVTLITGRFEDGELVILSILPGHEKAVVVEFLRCLKKELSEEAYKALKDSMHAFRKNTNYMNKEERKTFRKFFEHFASAKQVYDLREQLTTIFDMNLSKNQAQAKQRHLQALASPGSSD